MSRGPKPGSSSGESRGRTLLSWALLIVVGVFLGVAVVKNWSAVRNDLGRMSLADWGLTAFWGAAALVGSWGIWSSVLSGMGGHLGGHDSRSLFFSSQLGKYVPGSVWPAVIQSRLGRRHGIPARTMVASFAYALAVSVSAGGVIGLVSLVSSHSTSARLLGGGVAVVSVLGLVALLHPKGLLQVLSRVAGRFGRDLTIPDPSTSHKAAAVCLSFGSWVLYGLHAWSIARPLGAGPGDLLTVIGGFALAFVAGVLFLPVPGGAGVREAVLVLTIGVAIGRPEALTLALISRFVLLALDVVLALVFGAVPLLRSARRWASEESDDEDAIMEES